MSAIPGPPRGATITVAVATCGRPASLARALEALSNGTVAPDEVIVVDQAPSADSRRQVEQCGIAPTRYLEQARLGLSASRNLALRVASHDLLAVTDDDCAPGPGWIEAITAAFGRSPAPAAVTGPILPLGPQPSGSYAISLRPVGPAVDYRGRVIPWKTGSGGNFAAPCELLRRHAGWDERLGAGSPGKAAEDADLLYRILRAGGTIHYEPAAVVRHEWQTRDRRLATRWSYGYGIGALCGLCLRRGDPFAVRMLGSYAGLHCSQLAAVAWRRDRGRLDEHVRALASLLPGLVYGVTRAREGAWPDSSASRTLRPGRTMERNG